MSIDIKDLGKYLQTTLGSIPTTIKSPAFLNQLGQNLVTAVQERTRSGQGVATTGGSEYSFKPLSSGYVKQRRTMPLSGYTSPSKSNLTQTGQMLDSLTWNSANGKLSITFTNSEARRKAELVSDDRPFMNLSKTNIELIMTEVDKYISSLLKK